MELFLLLPPSSSPFLPLFCPLFLLFGGRLQIIVSKEGWVADVDVMSPLTVIGSWCFTESKFSNFIQDTVKSGSHKEPGVKNLID